MQSSRCLRYVIAYAVPLLSSAPASARHVDAPVVGQAANLAQCAQVQPAVENIITASMTRLEAARQSNDPAQLRAAVDFLGTALRDIRTQLAPCAVPAAAADPHAGHVMPKPEAPAAPPAKPGAAADPHAGHAKPAAKPAPPASAKPSGTPAQPKAAADPHAGHEMPPARKPVPPKIPATKPPAQAADPHAVHAAPAEAGKVRDPVNGLMVDPARAPKTTYQGRTYYFSSEASLKQFLENPAKFAKAPGQ